MPAEGKPHIQAVSARMAEASTEPPSLARVAAVGDNARPLAPKLAGQRQLEVKGVSW